MVKLSDFDAKLHGIMKSKIIDLTLDDDSSDDEPPPPKINSNGLKNRSINNDQPSTSRGLIATSWNATLKRFCVTCKSSENLIPTPPCNHFSCYMCFRLNILRQDSIAPKCETSKCNQNFTRSFIKSALNVEDYVRYLENVYENFCHTLKAKSKNGEKKEEIVKVEDFSEPIDESFVTNFFEFLCTICLERISTNEGVVLKNCGHFFCKVCISDTIRHSDEQSVLCPHRFDDGRACDSFLQDREIRSLVSEEIYENHLKKGLKQAEISMDDVFHCKTPDCDGFSIPSKDTKAFPCPVCQKVNCILCSAIHETKTCEQFKEDLVLDEQNSKDLAETEKQLSEMLKKGEAILCVNCKSVIQKIDGCNSVTCAICKTVMCWMTGKPRRPLHKIVNGIMTVIDGCRCMENGKFCHPKCQGRCH